MLYPSIQELLKKTEKNGKEELNKYSLVMASAKCARIITNEYLKERAVAEKRIANKEIDTKDIGALITKRYRDEKAVKNAVNELNDGVFEVYMPGDEGYETSTVEVVEYKEEVKEEKKNYKEQIEFALSQVGDDEEEYIDDYDEEEEELIDEEDFDAEDLMGSTEIFEEDSRFSIEESDE